VLDEPHGPRKDGRRAAVVDLEVDPSEAGQARRQAQDAPHVGEPPAVDALVVVADEEDPIRRRRQEQGQRQLAPVDVLDLVDQEVGAASPPAAEEGFVPAERPPASARARS
jgi:hypothetical protein